MNELRGHTTSYYEMVDEPAMLTSEQREWLLWFAILLLFLVMTVAGQIFAGSEGAFSCFMFCVNVLMLNRAIRLVLDWWNGYE